MNTILHGLSIYAFLLLIFRISGNRTLAQTTNFDFVLLLIISETTQQAMVGKDNSLTNSFLLILTLVSASIALSLLKQRFPSMDKWIDGAPVLLVEDGHLHHERMNTLRIDEMDLLEAARGSQGLERMDQIKYAVLERSGQISVIPKPR